MSVLAQYASTGNADPHVVSLAGKHADTDLFAIVAAAAVITVASPWVEVGGGLHSSNDWSSKLLHLPAADNNSGITNITFDLNGPVGLTAIVWEDYVADGTLYAAYRAGGDADPISGAQGTGLHTFPMRSDAFAFFTVYGSGGFAISGTSYGEGYTAFGDSNISVGSGPVRCFVGHKADTSFTDNGLAVTYTNTEMPSSGMAGMVAYDTFVPDDPDPEDPEPEPRDTFNGPRDTYNGPRDTFDGPRDTLGGSSDVLGGTGQSDPDPDPDPDPSEWPDATNTGYRNAPGYPGHLTAFVGTIEDDTTYSFKDFSSADIGTSDTAVTGVTLIGCRIKGTAVNNSLVNVFGDDVTLRYCSIEPGDDPDSVIESDLFGVEFKAGDRVNSTEYVAMEVEASGSNTFTTTGHRVGRAVLVSASGSGKNITFHNTSDVSMEVSGFHEDEEFWASGTAAPGEEAAIFTFSLAQPLYFMVDFAGGELGTFEVKVDDAADLAGPSGVPSPPTPFGDSYQYGVMQSGGYGTHGDGMIIEYCDIWGFGNAIDIKTGSPTKQMIIRHNWIHDAALNPDDTYHVDGIGMTSGEEYHLENALIYHNTVESEGNTNGLALQAAEYYKDVEITHNKFSGWGWTIAVFADSENVVFTDNVLSTRILPAFGAVHSFPIGDPGVVWARNTVEIQEDYAYGDPAHDGWFWMPDTGSGIIEEEDKQLYVSETDWVDPVDSGSGEFPDASLALIDDFNRTNNHTVWEDAPYDDVWMTNTKLGGGTDAWNIFNNTGVPFGTSSNQLSLFEFGPDFDLVFDFSAEFSSYFAVFFSVQNGTSGLWEAYWFIGIGANWKIRKQIEGVITTVGENDPSPVLGAGTKLGIRRLGTHIEVHFHDGDEWSQIMDVEDADIPEGGPIALEGTTGNTSGINNIYGVTLT